MQAGWWTSCGAAVAELRRRAELAHPAEAVYRVVATVEDYAEFLPWLERVEMLSRTPTRIDAVLHTSTHGLHNHYTMRFEIQPKDCVRMTMLDGPMQRLDGRWSFDRRDQHASTLRLELDYEFSNPMFGLLFGHTFRHAIDEMLDHVDERAGQLYG